MILILMIIHYPCNPLIPEDSGNLTQQLSHAEQYPVHTFSLYFKLGSTTDHVIQEGRKSLESNYYYL